MGRVASLDTGMKPIGGPAVTTNNSRAKEGD